MLRQLWFESGSYFQQLPLSLCVGYSLNAMINLQKIVLFQNSLLAGTVVLVMLGIAGCGGGSSGGPSHATPTPTVTVTPTPTTTIPAAFVGTYSANVVGSGVRIDNGAPVPVTANFTASLTVTANGQATGSAADPDQGGALVVVTGTVDSNGVANFGNPNIVDQTDNTPSGAHITFSGQISSDGIITGTWEFGDAFGSHSEGTFEGHK